MLRVLGVSWLQISVGCPPGTMYGHYFHSLLQTRGLLLLGVHRPVEQDGLRFKATITNPPFVSCPSLSELLCCCGLVLSHC